MEKLISDLKAKLDEFMDENGYSQGDYEFNVHEGYSDENGDILIPVTAVLLHDKSKVAGILGKA